MDVQVLLNAVLDTYREEEIDKYRRIHESLLKGRVSKLFRNGEFFQDIIELTLEQTKERIPVYELGGINPRQYTPGRLSITGRFLAEFNPEKHTDLQCPSVGDVFSIETMQLFEDGKTSKVQINGIFIMESNVVVEAFDKRAQYTYTADRVDVMEIF